MANLMSAQVAEKLKRMITSGEYPPNTKFPNEPALMAQLNVSRSTIREAIKLLQSNNILEIRRGVGTFVLRVPGEMEDPMSFDTIPEERKVKDLMELRLLLEPGVARLASERATPEDIAELRIHSAKLVQLTAKYGSDAVAKMTDTFADADAAFHSAIYRCTRNEALERMISFVRTTLTESYMRRDYRIYHAQFHTKDGHAKIIDAIERHDADAAERLTREHISYSMKFLMLESCKKN